LLDKTLKQSYEGEFKHDYKYGEGTLAYEDGSIYTGKFLNDLPHGEGTLEYANKDTYRGNFK